MCIDARSQDFKPPIGGLVSQTEAAEQLNVSARTDLGPIGTLQGDICAPIRGKGATRYDSAGRLILESKDHISERLNFSPDFGDAAALTMAIDSGVMLDRDPDDEEEDDWRSAAWHFDRSETTGY